MSEKTSKQLTDFQGGEILSEDQQKKVKGGNGGSSDEEGNIHEDVIDI